jgi:hypothetical protein
MFANLTFIFLVMCVFALPKSIWALTLSPIPEQEASQLRYMFLPTGDFSQIVKIYEQKTNSGSFHYKKFGIGKCGLKVSKKKELTVDDSGEVLTTPEVPHVEVVLIKTEDYPDCEFDNYIYGVYRIPTVKVSNYMYNTDPRVDGATEQIVYTRTLRDGNGDIVYETIGRPGYSKIGFYRWILDENNKLRIIFSVEFSDSSSIRKGSYLNPYK